METPLYNAIKALAEEAPLRFHLPGHKGKSIPFMENIMPYDFTELSRTGNLYEWGEPFAQAQDLWAREFGLPHCQFLTGGSTQGVYTALALCGKEGDKILLDRGAHRSAVNAMGILGLEPVYLPRPWLKDLEVPGAIDAETVNTLLKENPDIKTVFLTSPTVCGLLSDVYTIAEIVHSYGAKLIVDGAHGAHLPWLMIDNYSAADVVCVSAHKTLPCLGQSAMIFYRDFSPELVRETAALFGTSSPSYPMLVSMDLAREWMNQEGMTEYVRVARQVATLREILPCLTEPLYLDPTRLCILCHQGVEVAKELEKENIYLEMSNPGHLIGIFTAMDSDEEIQKLAKAIIPHFSHREPLPDLSPPDVLPERKMSIREVIFCDKITVQLTEAEGKIAGANIAPFPPGIPVVAMGEEISSLSLSYLKRIGYTKKEVLVVK
ncbi:MAG: aminotransferase class V-fold PLP-dependent enzyme [Eubacteriales bacterium]